MLHRNYEREARFYQELASTVAIRVPHCYHADAAPGGAPFVLLLEEVTGARMIDQVAGATLEGNHDAGLFGLAAAGYAIGTNNQDEATASFLPPPVITTPSGAHLDPAVQAARDRAIESVHAYLIGATSGADQAVRIQGDELVLDTGPLVEKLAAAVDPRLTPATVTLPEADRLVVLASAGALGTASDTLSVMEIVQFLIPIVAVIARGVTARLLPL